MKTKPAILEERPDFSLVLGGPLYQLFRRAHLAGDALELMRRRVLVLAGVAWVPLLLLSALTGRALGTIGIPFLQDIEAHVRFLVALPILIAAELVVHRRMRPAVTRFVERRIVGPEDMPKFHEAIDSTLRIRNSLIAEVGLLVLVYTLGLWVWKSQVALGTPSWYATPDAAGMHLTPAGFWYAFVSVPLFQFILLRWYFRFFLWFWFLWRVSRLDLRLIPIHPDKAAGLSFLGTSTIAFAPILFAQGALLAGLIASQIFHAGQDLMAFRVEVVAFLAFSSPSCSARWPFSRRASRARSGRAWASSAPWPAGTSGSSRRSGCMAARRRMIRSWEAATSSHWPTSGTATASSRKCASCPSE